MSYHIIIFGVLTRMNQTIIQQQQHQTTNTKTEKKKHSMQFNCNVFTMLNISELTSEVE
jgi:hypothetical protein